MIQIYRDFVTLAKDHANKLINDYEFEDSFTNEIKNDNSPFDNFLIFLKKEIPNILQYNPSDLEKHIISQADKMLGKDYFTKRVQNTGKRGQSPKVNKVDIKTLNRIFDYEKFRDAKNKYNSYELVKCLNIVVCPYCNRNYISTLSSTISNNKVVESGTKPTLDHFYLKSDFPYLALSFWNLVPSCYSCNSQLRTTKPFSIKENIHPYVNSFENTLYFQTDFDEIDEFLGDSDNELTIRLSESHKTNKNSAELSKAKYNSKVFRLEDLYNDNHKAEAREIIQKALIYDKHYSQDLYASWPDIFSNEYDARIMMLGNYTEIKDFEKRPLSKFTRDIASEAGII